MILKKQTTAYQDIKNDIQTGDIILMHGLYASSHVIEAFEGNEYSHVAILIKAKDIGIENSEDILLWESNGESELKDVILNKSKSGPQLLNLHEKLLYDSEKKLDSKFAIRHLYVERNKKMFSAIKSVIKEVHNAKFPDTYHECHDPLEGRFKHKQTPLDTMFCSELVAYTYTKMGLLSNIHPYNSYFPVDFSEKLSVGLLKRAWLGNEIMLNIDISKIIKNAKRKK